MLKRFLIASPTLLLRVPGFPLLLALELGSSLRNLLAGDALALTDGMYTDGLLSEAMLVYDACRVGCGKRVAHSLQSLTR